MRRVGLTLTLAGLITLPVVSTATPPTPAEFARYAESLLAEAFSADAPGAAMLVMRGDEVLYRGARGLADVTNQVPLQPGDRFRIASVTKTVSAAGLLTLVDAGKVALTDPLSRYLPTYPGAEGITIEQLLNHTSGVRDYTSIPGVFDGPIRRDVTTAQLIDYFKNEAPDFAPGKGWRYSNSGYVLFGAVIETVTGEPWHRYLRRALFEPLAMSDTGYGADPAVAAGHVNGYATIGGVPTAPLPLSMTQPHAAGGLVSTVDDLVRFHRALHAGQVLRPETYLRMITPVGPAKSNDYGYGINVSPVRGVPAYQHDGLIAGFSAHVIHVQGAEVTVAVLHNSETPTQAQTPANIARRLAAVAIGDPYPPVTPVALDAALLRQYEGVYRVDDESVRTLRVVDGALTAQRSYLAAGEASPREALIAIADDTFVYPDGFSRLQLERDAGGNVSAMRIWLLGEGEGAVAPITDQAVPIDFDMPGDAFARLLGRYGVLILGIVAALAVFFATTRWRRRQRQSR